MAETFPKTPPDNVGDVVRDVDSPPSRDIVLGVHFSSRPTIQELEEFDPSQYSVFVQALVDRRLLDEDNRLVTDIPVESCTVMPNEGGGHTAIFTYRPRYKTVQ
tara:strand:+ start:2098 stop:2409 length:312 start_codon:yes stop_codon:yes gene_type:complete